LVWDTGLAKHKTTTYARNVGGMVPLAALLATPMAQQFR